MVQREINIGGQVGKQVFHFAILFSSDFESTLEASKKGLDARMVMGDEGKRTERSWKPDPKAKKLAKNTEKKGAVPPEKPSLTVDKPTLLTSYETLKATMADKTVQTSESDKGEDLITSTPMPPRRNVLVPETPDYGDEAASSKDDKDNMLIERASNQGLKVPTLKIGGRRSERLKRRPQD
jgi:hypothetical protein